MYCNHCGAGEQVSKSYCRQCGKWIGTGPPEERLLVTIIFNALSALFALVAAMLLFATNPGLWTISLAATFCLIITVYQTLSFFFALNLRRRLKVGRAGEQQNLIQSSTIEALPEADTSRFVHVPSVTESTTELLERKR